MATLLKHHPSIHAQASTSICAQAMPTYVTQRTNEEVGYVSSYLTFGNAHRGAERFESDVDPFGCDLCGCVLNCDGSCGPECDHQEQAHA